MEEIVGYIERFTYHDEESGYTVAQLKEPKKKELTCVVGKMLGVKPGETLRCIGTWKNHLVHGRQFELDHFKSERPADLIGIKKYLGSGLIKGIGPSYAEKIVAAFGLETLDVIDTNPEKLLTIKGLGESKLNKIIECWQAQKSIRQVMIFLQTHGVSPAYAQKIYKTYGDGSIEKVSENPYRLARDIFGIGFKMADEIAQRMGVARNSPARLAAGIEFLLNELSNEGHVCVPEAELIQLGHEKLEVDNIEAALPVLLEERRIERLSMVLDGSLTPFIWLRNLYVAETGISTELKRILQQHSPLRSIDTDKAIAWAESKLNIQLAPTQKKAVKKALKEKALIITGGPGTGKSTITNVILLIISELTPRLLLAAPTGRAAKRMTEITKRHAKTIHSLLEVNFKEGGFKRNRENPLECDFIVIDESSMIDTPLMYALLKAIPSQARVLFIGDINQLPSVGPGNVLKDLIGTQLIPTVELTEIFRQAQGSQIILNAHRINKGTVPDLKPNREGDFFFIEENIPEKLLAQLIALVSVRLPHTYKLSPLHDIQVLAPMRRGVIGIENLNNALQEALNPRRDYIMRGGRRYAIGDKVMQMRNNYQKEVYNGDIGFIENIDSTEESLIINYEGRHVEYEFSELEEITLAYAVSIHKYQGSESKCIILLIHTSHFKLLTRNLFYTGVTRGKNLVILLGNSKAVFLATNNNEVQKRYTGLRHFLLSTLTFNELPKIELPVHV